MHEFSLANQIVDKVLAVAREKKAKKIESIEVSVGELILLGEEKQLKFWIREILNKEEIAKGASIKINAVKALVKCKKCGYEGNLKPDSKHDHLHPVFLCPDCGQSDIDIIKGRDCVIKRVEVEI